MPPSMTAPVAAILSFTLALAGCGKVLPGRDAPDASPAASSVASSVSAAVPSASAAPAPGASAQFGASTADFLPLAAGQWVRFATTRGAEKGTMTYSVLAQEGTADRVEIVTHSGGKKNIVQLLADFHGRKDAALIELKEAKMKLPNGQVQTFSGATLEPIFDSVKSQLGGLLTTGDPSALPRADVTVPAGTFHGCFVHATTEHVFGMTENATGWVHSAIPVVSMARMTATVNGQPQTYELETFAMTGARSEL